MPQGAANITSIDAVRILRAALAQFGKEVGDALTALDLEGRRPLEWIDQDRSRYWPAEVQKATNEVSEARLALQKCELTIDGEDARYCYDERKTLEKAKRRLRLAEDKVQAVKRWRVKIHKEVQDFQVQIAKLRSYVDGDLLRGLAALGRMAEALDRYAQSGGEGPTVGANIAAGAAQEGAGG